MADALSIMYVALSAIKVAKNTYNLFDAIKNTDSRLDQLYYRLKEEKLITEGWANSVRLKTGSGTRLDINPESVDEVKELLEKLKTYFERASERYHGLGSKIGPSSKSSSIHSLGARTKYVFSGYDQLKEVVDTITALNKALKAIAPPLPPYDFSSQGAVRYHTASQGGQPGPAPTSNNDQESDRLPERAQTTAKMREVGTFRGAALTPGDSPSEHLPSLREMYSLCLKTLWKIFTYRQHKDLEFAASRLKLWGLGLFDGPLPLDIVLSVQMKLYSETASQMVLEETPQPVRTAILITFAYILLFEERELARLQNNSSDDVLQDLSSLKTEVSALLGTDELVITSIENQARWLEDKKRRETYLIAAVQGQAVSEREYKSISQVIAAMFQLIPTIRAQRRAYSCIIEAQQPEETKSEGVSTPQPIRRHTTTSPVVATEAMLDEQIAQDIAKIHSHLAKIDRSEVTGGNNPLKLESIFNKQAERFNELRRSSPDESLQDLLQEDHPEEPFGEPKLEFDPGDTDRMSGRLDRIRNKKREELEKAISSFASEIRSTEHPTRAGGKLEGSIHPDGDKKLFQQTFSNEKKPPEGSEQIGSERVREFLDSIRNISI